MNPSRLKRLFLLSASLALTCGCQSTPTKEDPIARVNGMVITAGDYLNLLESLTPKELSLTGKDRAEMKNLVLKTLVRRQIVLSEAQKKGVSLSQEELSRGLEKYKAGYSSGSFEQSLLEQMVDKTDWEEKVRQNLLIEKLFEESRPQIPTPSLEEALEFYQTNRRLFVKNAMAKAQQIVVKDLELAKDLRKKVLKSPKDFVKLARENSIGPEASDQGNAEILIEKDALPEPLDRALFELKIGEVSQVIQSPYGYHIIKPISRSTPLNLDFQQVKSEILERLQQEKRREWILKFEERLVRQAQIEYNRDLIEKL